jgi:hypothetical protein
MTKTVMLTARLTPAEHERAAALAAAWGCTISEAIRRLVRQAFLAE